MRAPSYSHVRAALRQRLKETRTALVVAGYRVSVVEPDGLKWTDAHDSGPCRHGQYYTQRASNGETAIMWSGDALP